MSRWRRPSPTATFRLASAPAADAVHDGARSPVQCTHRGFRARPRTDAGAFPSALPDFRGLASRPVLARCSSAPARRHDETARRNARPRQGGRGQPGREGGGRRARIKRVRGRNGRGSGARIERAWVDRRGRGAWIDGVRTGCDRRRAGRRNKDALPEREFRKDKGHAKHRRRKEMFDEARHCPLPCAGSREPAQNSNVPHLTKLRSGGGDPFSGARNCASKRMPREPWP